MSVSDNVDVCSRIKFSSVSINTAEWYAEEWFVGHGRPHGHCGPRCLAQGHANLSPGASSSAASDDEADLNCGGGEQ